MSAKRTATFLSIFALVVMVLGVFATAGPAYASPDETGGGADVCPEGGDWVKVDGLSGHSYSYSAPAGKLVAEVCYKHAWYLHQYDVTPPAPGVIVIADWHPLPFTSRWWRPELSHASFRLVDAPEPPEPPDGEISRTVIDGDCVEGGREWTLNFSNVTQNTGDGAVYMLVIIDGVTYGPYNGSGPFQLNLVLGAGSHSGDIELWYSPPEGEDILLDAMRGHFNVEACDIYTVRTNSGADCEGWFRHANLYLNGEFFMSLVNESGTWSDPYHYESVPVASYDVPDQYGNLPDVQFDELQEPAHCHDFNIRAFTKVDCEGWLQKVNLRDGNQWLKVLAVEQGTWTDPYTLETVPGWTFDIPDEYGGGSVDLDPAVEPELCIVNRIYKAHQAYLEDSCEGIRRVINLYEGPPGDPYQTLVGTLYNEVFYFTNPFVLETIPAVTVDVPAEYGEDYTFAAMEEPEVCKQVHQTDVWYQADCNQYWGGYILDGEKVETFRGDWKNPYKPESVTVDVIVPIPEGEEGESEFTITIHKDADCIKCKVTKVYPMASYIAYDAPDNYWKGPFGMGPGVCVVIHPEGQVPSAERVAVICSLCEDQVEGGYIYDVRDGNGNMFFDGWLYRISCYGKDPYYMYNGLRWNEEWVREKDFNSKGERLTCRVEGCADWIHENYPE